MPGRLIVNADDFGIGPGINEGILRLAERGRITSLTALACGKHFAEGMKRLRALSLNVGVGVHLCLDEERPVLPPAEVPSLVTAQGFLKSRSRLLLDVSLGRVSLAEVRRELEAQVRRFLDCGVTPTHFDGHGHIHLLPALADVIGGLAQSYGLGKTRATYDPVRWDRWQPLGRMPARLLLNKWYKRSKRAGILSRLRSPDQFFGLANGGHIQEKHLVAFVGEVGEETTEIMVHPGLPTQEEVAQYGHWGYSWEGEYQALDSEGFAKAIAASGTKLIHYGEL